MQLAPLSTNSDQWSVWAYDEWGPGSTLGQRGWEGIKPQKERCTDEGYNRLCVYPYH